MRTTAPLECRLTNHKVLLFLTFGSKDYASDCTRQETSWLSDIISCSPENNCLVIEVSACHRWQVLLVFHIFILLSSRQILFSFRKLLNNTGRNWFLICPFISPLFPPCSFRIEVAALEIVSLANHPLGSTRHGSCLPLGPARQKSTVPAIC